VRRDAARGLDREPHGSSDDPELLDFSANTNPETPAGVEAVYRDAFDSAQSYPVDPPERYRETAADYVDCDAGQVVPTPGGLAAIRLVIELTVGADDTVLVPYPSFGEYAREVRLKGAEPVFVPQDQILTADPAAHSLAIICNPNNPTGDAYSRDDLDSFVSRCRATGTTVLVDEAFLGFTDRSSLAGAEGVVVARSLTKLFGLPGIRAGFAVATGDLLAAMLSARRTWNVSVPALETGRYCMGQSDFVTETTERVESECARMTEALSGSFDVSPSEAPFLLLEVGDRSVRGLCERARKAGVAIRDATTFRGLDSHARVAVRRPAENDRLIEVLTDV
jgi:threonine-phosphate decarboxylase